MSLLLFFFIHWDCLHWLNQTSLLLSHIKNHIPFPAYWKKETDACEHALLFRLVPGDVSSLIMKT